ncbi:hypothetical protein C5167_029146 [Papaver somniferum]|uniref:uncharacterized protein LOC113343699 n=1 Tax=Papaver somniferum TaxID=3469 RepID=UPI000E6F92DF|nr:uncharacterized protein LOC113343699 [Papaver somniferum]RZC93169.1 hypothetical protein C5167_029146 [Papaver somniferum]
MVKKNAQQERKKDEQLKKTIKNPPKAKSREDSFRCSLTHLCMVTPKRKALTENKKEHMKALVACSFWNFYKPFYEDVMKEEELKKKMVAVKMILSTYDKKSPRLVPDCFKLKRIKNLILQTTPEQLSVTFGLQMMEQVTLVIDEHLRKKLNLFVNE